MSIKPNGESVQSECYDVNAIFANYRVFDVHLCGESPLIFHDEYENSVIF